MGTDPEDNGDGHIDEFDESEEFDPADLVTITDEDGTEIDCAVLAVMDHEGESYALLARLEQLDSDSEEVEMFIFHYALDDEGNQMFSSVDDDATYEAVRQEFSLLIAQDE